jgi:hypothetical protein
VVAYHPVLRCLYHLFNDKRLKIRDFWTMKTHIPAYNLIFIKAISLFAVVDLKRHDLQYCNSEFRLSLNIERYK